RLVHRRNLSVSAVKCQNESSRIVKTFDPEMVPNNSSELTLRLKITKNSSACSRARALRIAADWKTCFAENPNSARHMHCRCHQKPTLARLGHDKLFGKCRVLNGIAWFPFTCANEPLGRRRFRQ